MNILAPATSPRSHVGHNPLGSSTKGSPVIDPVLLDPQTTGKGATKESLNDVREATRDVLTRVFPDCLAGIGYEDDASCTVDECGRLIEVCGVRYTLTFAGSTIRLWVGVNVYRIIVILFLERDRLHDPDVADLAGDALIPRALRHGIRGARHVGYDVHVEEASVEGHDVLSLWMTNWLPRDFLRSPIDQIFIGQDLALMIQSLCRAAARDNLKLRAAVDPRPL